jgi:hypothetical protein
MILATAVSAVLAAWLLLLGLFARRLQADWREPVLAAPVLIVESDDWGPGPPADGTRLQALLRVLRKHRGADGRPPVITLGVVLAAPGVGVSVAANLALEYSPSILDEERYSSILAAMREGSSAGVFALQLHGREHFWPLAVIKAARHDPQARAFLQGGPTAPRHEMLASHLQSRWVDAASLPSVALDREAIERAVGEETACFRRVFGAPARVAVPVTFVWTTDVEAAWARHGIRVVVTPGSRNVGRDAEGRLVADGSILRNGDPAPGAMCYVVRDVYFEPALGHTAERTLQEIRERHRLGRPALVEMHRFNFTGDPVEADRALGELDRLLAGALRSIPRLRFMSTEALSDALRMRDPALVDRRTAARLRTFVLRAATQHRLRKLAWLSGLALPAVAIYGAASLLLPGAGHPKSAVGS